ncbi:MAG: GNAT family protein [Corynebacterium sp.]|uniref:GNAT family N-acetyltransferase n=1 Tax=Corynebacterium sp. TaxID=1720 RepID=UPI0026DDC0B9|nr:GNAT family protein [Corynebacterium sp.]MDO5030491.1 GNAT family protein [Corynebacterium sp.]
MRTARLITKAGRVRLRVPERSDARSWRELRLADEHILRPVEPTINTDWDSAHKISTYRRNLRSWRRSEADGDMIVSAIDVNGQLAGMLTLGSITPFPVGHAWIGYWVGSRFTRGGAATAAVALACDYATKIGIHRLEATVLDSNVASISVLQNCGFEFEGVAREAFHMDGQWRDHLTYARIGDTSAVEKIVSDGRARYEEAEKYPPQRRA